MNLLSVYDKRKTNNDRLETELIENETLDAKEIKNEPLLEDNSLSSIIKDNLHYKFHTVELYNLSFSSNFYLEMFSKCFTSKFI